MYCVNCGAEIKDDATFCTKCGAKTQAEENETITPAAADVSVQETAQAVAPAVAVTDSAAPDNEPADSQPKKKPAIIIAIAVAVVIVVAAIGVFVFMQAQKHEKTHALVTVPINVTYTDDGANDPIGVPLIIEGTDLDNKHVEQRFLAPATGGDIELQAGSYTVRVSGPTPSKTGEVYQEQGESSITLEVPVPDEGDSKSSTPVANPTIDVTLEPLPIESVTEEDIEKMEEWMEAFDVSPSEAEEAMNAVIKKRDDEVARAKLEQEMQAALNANPSLINAGGLTYTSQCVLTGTVQQGTFNGRGASSEVIYLQLPRELAVHNIKCFSMNIGPETKQSDRIVIGALGNGHIGKTVSITMQIEWIYDKTPENACSTLRAINASVTRVFE